MQGQLKKFWQQRSQKIPYKNTHTGEEPCNSRICNKDFINPSSLKLYYAGKHIKLTILYRQTYVNKNDFRPFL